MTPSIYCSDVTNLQKWRERTGHDNKDEEEKILLAAEAEGAVNETEQAMSTGNVAYFGACCPKASWRRASI